MIDFEPDLLERTKPRLEDRYFIMFDRLAKYLFAMKRRKRHRTWGNYMVAVARAFESGDQATLRRLLEAGYMRMRNQQRPDLRKRVLSLRKRMERGEHGREITSEDLYARIRAAEQ